MVLVHSVRAGAELIGDIGLEQNVISNAKGGEEQFLSVIWTMQIFRGLLLSSLCVLAVPVLARFYLIDPLVLLGIAAAPLLNALSSTSVYSLSKRQQVKARNLFELGAESAGLLINVALALVLHSIWAPVLGVLLTLVVRSGASYAFPRPPLRLTLHRDTVVEILHFGKWISSSSLMFYATLYIDRLFLARNVSLPILGVYGLARTISDLPAALASRIGYLIIFPLISADHDRSARAKLAPTRFKFILLAGFGIATGIAWSDRIVILLYGARFHEAGWMLSLLLVGSWISVLANINESVVLGKSQPKYVSAGAAARIVVLAAGIPVAFYISGLAGAIVALITGEAARYAVMVFAQRLLRVSFLSQDACATIVVGVIVICWTALRLASHLGPPWGDLG